jgi:hypothetical protein
MVRGHKNDDERTSKFKRHTRLEGLFWGARNPSTDVEEVCRRERGSIDPTYSRVRFVTRAYYQIR